MSPLPPVKLIPRNVAAVRRGRAPKRAADIVVVAGNPMSTRLESGIGNCFPGLECDLRNLERRFFPFLETDIGDNSIVVVGVDSRGAAAAANSGGLPADAAKAYQTIARDVAASRSWQVTQLAGTFGSLGRLTIDIATLNPPSSGNGRRPPDAWTAVRMLTEGTQVVLTLTRGNATLQLTGNRARYLDDNGALADMFLPGELTQSLCSPWTHDFRDCGCYYWASNHPDIALPPLPPMASPDDPQWNLAVMWERQDRTIATPPRPATLADPTPFEMRYQEINDAWQSLNFVVGRREIVTPFDTHAVTGEPLASRAELQRYLRYAAGVELAVAQEYLAAAYSLKSPDGLPGALADDIRACHAEIMRIAIGEMKHLRAVNDVLRGLMDAGTFAPALQVASQVPGQAPGETRPVIPRAATQVAIADFIDIERPSVSVDGVYARILATLVRDGPHDLEQSVRTIMAEGDDHFETFLAFQQWLGRHQESDYLRSISATAPPGTDPGHRNLQTAYVALLEKLHQGYTLGGMTGAPFINAARTDMLGSIDGLAQAIADRGFLVVFDPIADSRFGSIDPP
jgi:Ferritin-like